MTLMPVVARELRVASRRWTFFWGRLVAAGGFVLAAMVGLMTLAMEGGAPSGVGLFMGMGWLAFGLCCGAGPAVAADVLSAERRQGTLGLLFLTDLRPLDVVLGKLAAVSIQAVSALLASLPVVAVCLLLGGVTMEQLTAMAVVCFNALFFSLSCTVVVSASCIEGRSAFALSTFLVGTTVLLLPRLDDLLSGNGWWEGWLPAWSVLRLLSPTHGMERIQEQLGAGGDLLADPGLIGSVALVQGLGWMALWGSAFLLRRSWQEPVGGSLPARVWEVLMRWTFGDEEDRRRLRAMWLDRNPWAWLGYRNRLKQRLLWGVLSPILPVWGLLGWLGWSPRDAASTLLLAYCVLWLVKVLLASEASQLFAESRRNGAFELLLTTPLGEQEIIRGHLATLRRWFALPTLVTIFTAHLLVLGELSIREWLWVVLGSAVLGSDLPVLARVAMWRGLAQKRAHLASLSALVRVLFWPSAIVLPLALVTGIGSPHGFLLFAAVSFLASNVMQGTVAAEQLRGGLRRQAAEV